MRTPATSEEQAEYKALLADKFARLGKLTSRYAWLKKVQLVGGFILGIGLPIVIGTYWGQASVLVPLLGTLAFGISLYFWFEDLTKKQAEYTFFEIAQASEINYHRFGVYELDKYDAEIATYKKGFAPIYPMAGLYFSTTMISSFFVILYNIYTKEIITPHTENSIDTIKKMENEETLNMYVFAPKSYPLSQSDIESRLELLEIKLIKLRIKLEQNRPHLEADTDSLEAEADFLEEKIYNQKIKGDLLPYNFLRRIRLIQRGIRELPIIQDTLKR